MSQLTASSTPNRGRSAVLICVGSALWLLSLAPWGASIDGEPAFVDLTPYVSLFIGAAGALLALHGVRRLLRQVQPRLDAPGSESASSGRRSNIATSLITAGTLVYLAADITYWVLPTSGSLVIALLYAVASLGIYVGGALVLSGLYLVLRKMDDHIAATPVEKRRSSQS